MANEKAEQPNEMDSTDSDDSQDGPNQLDGVGGNEVDYKKQYRDLKSKLKYLIYENEFFQESLRSNQRRLLKVTRDRTFLLDRLLQYEKPENTTSESEASESSEDEVAKKAKLEPPAPAATTTTTNGAPPQGPAKRGRKKKITPTLTHAQVAAAAAAQQQPSLAGMQMPHMPVPLPPTVDHHQRGHMSAAEVERHLQSKQTVVEPIMPERTVPVEMFSNEPSLDSESNDMMGGGSPTHVAAEECVEYN